MNGAGAREVAFHKRHEGGEKPATVTCRRRGYNWTEEKWRGSRGWRGLSMQKGKEGGLCGWISVGKGKSTGRWDQRGQGVGPCTPVIFTPNVMCVKNCVGGRTLLCLQANKYVCCFVDAGRRLETLGPETNMANW